MIYPFVSVVVGIRNEEIYISECIESLLNQDYPIDRYEIIIVDGISTDNTRDIVKQYPVKLILNEKMNVAAARNLGVKEAKGDYIAFTDGDCKADVNWLKTLVQAILDAPVDVVCVGGPNLIFDSDPNFAKVVGYAQETFLGSGGSAQANNSIKKKYVQSLPNCNALYKKFSIIEVGAFDEYFVVGQDGDLNYRINKKGYRFLYIPEAIVWHHRRGNLKSFSKRMFNYGKWMAELFKKHRGLVRWYALLPPLFLTGGIFFTLLSFYNLQIMISLAIIVLIYMFALICSSLCVISKMRSFFGAISFFILPVQHIMYGLGFISSIIKYYSCYDMLCILCRKRGVS